MAIRFLLLRVLVVLSLFVFSLAVLAQEIIKSVPVGNEPRGIAVNPFTDTVFVSNVQDGTVSILKHDTVIDTVPIDTLATVAVADAARNKIYFAGCNFFAGTGSMVVVMDGRTHRVIKDVQLNDFCAMGIQGIGINPLTHRVYVSDYDEKQEVVLDGNTNRIVARINLIRQPDGVDVDLRTNRVWIALDGPGGNIAILDGFKNKVVKTFSVGDTFIMGMAVNSFTRRAYISSELAPASLFVLDLRTQQTIATVPIGLFGDSVALDPLSNLIFATDGQGSTLTVVNGRNNTVRKVISLNALFPVYVAANPVTEHVYVSGFASGLVDVISERSHEDEFRHH